MIFALSLLSLSLSLSSLAQVIVNSPTPGQVVTFVPNFDDDSSCLTADSNTDGAPVYLANCAFSLPNRSWDVTAGANARTQLKIFGDKCLDVKDGVDADGTLLQIWTCADGNTNQQFFVNRTSGTVRWNHDSKKCLDLKNGKVFTPSPDGTPVQIWTCFEANDNQQWTPATLGNQQAVSKGGSALIGKSVTVNEASTCIMANDASDGSALVFGLCNNGPNGNWTLTAGSSISGPGPSGQIMLAPSNRCITIPDGNATDGTKLVVSTCVDANANQGWSVNGDLTIRSALDPTKCLDLTDGNEFIGTLIQIWDCTKFNRNQEWEKFQVT